MKYNPVEQPQKTLSKLYQTWSGNQCAHIEPLPPSGSYRQYYRLHDHAGHTVIGAYNEDTKENHAFIAFTNHFVSKKLPVPQILHQATDMRTYLLDDLGNTSLLDFLTARQHHVMITDEIRTIYQTIVAHLLLFQTEGAKGFDDSLCYPRAVFDRQSMMWDLNYFKYYFLKLARVAFDEQLLENDFNTLCDYLLTADTNYFLYRDFQSRNVMLVDNKPYFIDYQGGRRGALHYDIASILFEAKTDLPPSFRQEILEYYIKCLNSYMTVDDTAFRQHFYAYAYIRTMQAMGAYGFRGLYERKTLFLQSIPPALDVLDWLTTNVCLTVHLPELYRVWRSLVDSEFIRNLGNREQV